jgi:hypothetical protein
MEPELRLAKRTPKENWRREREELICPNAHDPSDVEVLEPVKVLHQAESIGIDVRPVSLATWSLGKRSDGLVPLPSLGDDLSLEVVATLEQRRKKMRLKVSLRSREEKTEGVEGKTNGEPPDRGLGSGYSLGNVDSHTVSSVLYTDQQGGCSQMGCGWNRI